MFHTFESSQYASPEKSEGQSSSSKRRTSTVRACEPCRRRKIRCNGEHPCESCQWYKKASTCFYTEPRQRQMPSRRAVDKINATLQEYRAILQKLFPSVHPDGLADLPRERLIDMINKNSPSTEPLSPITPILDDRPPDISPDAGSLEVLQTMPEDFMDGTERKSRGVPGISDDVNALSLSVKKSSTYLGISSVMAVLRVILWLDPESQAFLTKTPDRSAIESREHSSPPEEIEQEQTPHAGGTSSAWDEIPLINAYFAYVHTFIPLIDEQSFRDTYMTGRRSDKRWSLLLNTVLSMGSVAASTSDDRGHRIYFTRTKAYLDLDCLGTPHLETVQALGVLGGFYLHYLQQPNLANVIMGVALRMSTTLGLHRDYLEGLNSTKPKNIEMRRRIWWCLFNLDAWCGSTLGRPSMRIGSALTAKLPQEPIAQSVPMLNLLQENVRFCVISTRMEDALAVSPIIPEAELASLDDAFLEWYKTSSANPTTPRSFQAETAGMTVTKTVMRWRYLSSRIILTRPVLLWYAMRRMPYDNLPPEKKTAIQTCREIACELINDIASSWRGQKPCQMSGWNATWLLYQTVMVPLLSLFSDSQDRQVVESSRQQVESTMMTLNELRGWSATAHRSFEVVSRIFEASKRLCDDRGGFQTNLPMNTTESIPMMSQKLAMVDMNVDNQEVLMDNMFDSLNWSTGWDNLDYPFETPSAGFAPGVLGGWSSSQGFEGYFDPILNDQPEGAYPDSAGKGHGNNIGSERYGYR